MRLALFEFLNAGFLLSDSEYHAVIDIFLNSLLISVVMTLAINVTPTLLTSLYLKCKKHFIKMLKDVGMVVPKMKETRL